MKRYYVQLQTGEGGRGFALVFECEHDSVDAIANTLKSGRPVVGDKLSLSRQEDGGPRRIVGRTRFAFGFPGLICVQVWLGTAEEAA